MRISDWSSDVCSSDLRHGAQHAGLAAVDAPQRHQPGSHEREHHVVQGVDGPAQEGCVESAFARMGKLAEPAHVVSPLTMSLTVSRRAGPDPPARNTGVAE